METRAVRQVESAMAVAQSTTMTWGSFVTRARAALTVVVVTYNSSTVLGDCLMSLPAALSDFPASQVVVVDNESSDDSLLVAIDALPTVMTVNMGRNAGYAAAINAGIAAADAHGDVVVMNPDIRVRPDTLRQLARAEAASGAGIVAPKLVDSTGGLLLSQRRDPRISRILGEAVLGGRRAGRLGLSEIVSRPVDYQRGGWVDWATGAILLISAECLAAVGPWEESFFLYSEETDFCQRARNAGFGVRFEPKAVATHLGGDLETSASLRTHLVRNKLRLYRRRHSAAAAHAYRAALLVNDGIRAARGSALHRAGAAELVRPEARSVSGPASDDRTGFVFFSAQDFWYHNRAHSDFQLARQLASTRPMLFVNSIGMRMPKPGVTTQTSRRVLRKLRSMTRLVQRPVAEVPNLYVMSPVILPFYGNALLRKANARLVSLQVAAVLRWMGMPEPNAIVTIPTAVDVIALLRIRSLIVNRSDKYSAFGETEQHTIRKMEEALLGEADAAVFVSHQLMSEEAPLVKGDAVFLGHGVDFDHFATPTRKQINPEMAAIDGPIIGFFGGLDDYVVDFGLLEKVAHDLPNATLVLIGDATCPMGALIAHPNVRWLGPKSYLELPTYAVGFDVAIMPWLANEWIEHCNPIKVKEYLALGLPVVTTKYPEAAWLDDVIDIAGDAEDFVNLIDKALAGGGKSDAAGRRAKVRDDSWAARASVVRDLADQASR
jgi:GT2 family glycosyltransferase/glycosyltransferase involved in cell wall biosynthesis